MAKYNETKMELIVSKADDLRKCILQFQDEYPKGKELPEAFYKKEWKLLERSFQVLSSAYVESFPREMRGMLSALPYESQVRKRIPDYGNKLVFLQRIKRSSCFGYKCSMQYPERLNAKSIQEVDEAFTVKIHRLPPEGKGTKFKNRWSYLVNSDPTPSLTELSKLDLACRTFDGKHENEKDFRNIQYYAKALHYEVQVLVESIHYSAARSATVEHAMFYDKLFWVATKTWDKAIAIWDHTDEMIKNQEKVLEEV